MLLTGVGAAAVEHRALSVSLDLGLSLMAGLCPNVLYYVKTVFFSHEFVKWMRKLGCLSDARPELTLRQRPFDHR